MGVGVAQARQKSRKPSETMQSINCTQLHVQPEEQPRALANTCVRACRLHFRCI